MAEANIPGQPSLDVRISSLLMFGLAACHVCSVDICINVMRSDNNKMHGNRRVRYLS